MGIDGKIIHHLGFRILLRETEAKRERNSWNKSEKRDIELRKRAGTKKFTRTHYYLITIHFA